MQTAKIKAYIGFAIKSGAIVYGVDNIERKRTQIIIYSNKLSLTSAHRLQNAASKYSAELIELEDNEFEKLFQGQNIKAFAITNSSLASAIKESI